MRKHSAGNSGYGSSMTCVLFLDRQACGETRSKHSCCLLQSGVNHELNSGLCCRMPPNTPAILFLI